MNLRDKRLALFHAIEPGSQFWARQLHEHGAESVYLRILDGLYDPIKNAQIIKRLREFNHDKSYSQLSELGVEFLTPEDEGWPTGINDLETPPIGLIVKGHVEVVRHKSLAIVGTRNPTPYGVRIAGDFAAGFVDREWDIVSGGAY